MNKITLRLVLAALLGLGSGLAMACEYKAGETKFVDYANCRYGPDSIAVVDLPDTVAWEQCVYFVQAFRPAKLLAVTRMEGEKEVASFNDRSQIGNPCYLTKSACDKALKEAGY